MSDEQARSQGAQDDLALLGSLRSTLKSAPEAQRIRLIAGLLNDWAQELAGSREAGDQVRSLSKKAQDLEATRADLQDALDATRAELSESKKLLEIEQGKTARLQQTLEKNDARLSALQQEVTTLETKVTQHASDLHQAQREREQFEVKSQRLELASTDRTQFEQLQAENRRLAAELQRVTTENESYRQERQSLSDRLVEREQVGQADVSRGADAMLHKLWETLMTCKPPLVRSGTHMSTEGAEQLVRAFAEMASFTQRHEQSLRALLDKYIRHNSALSRPWRAYVEKSEKEDVAETMRQILDPTTGKTADFLRMKLKMTEKWAMAASLSLDAALAHIPTELSAHLMEERYAGTNRNFTVRDYIKDNGPDHFRERLLALQAENLEKAFRGESPD